METGKIILVLVVLFCFLFCAFLIFRKSAEDMFEEDKYRYYHGIDLTQCPAETTQAEKCKWLLSQEPGKGYNRVRDLAEANRAWLVFERRYRPKL